MGIDTNMQIVYGTTNESKIRYMKEMLKGLDIKIVGISDLNTNLPDVEENGIDPIDNAVIKAKAYYNVIKQPVFSADSGLYLDGVNDEEQPGAKARRVNGKRLNDREMVEHYCSLAAKYGGKLKAHYRNAIAMVIDEDNIIMCNDGIINSEPFYIVDKPYGKLDNGFPLDSISVDITSGKYYYEIDKVEYEWDRKRVYQEFFAEAKRLFHNK